MTVEGTVSVDVSYYNKGVDDTYPHKACSKCQRTLGVAEFYRDAHTKDGLTSHCKICRRTASAKYSQANRTAQTEAHKRWYAANRHTGARTIALRTRYGITPVEYEAMLLAQEGRCAICRTDCPGRNRSYFSVDHDRACCPSIKSCGACIRGLLCARCNTALGMLDDDAEAFARAVGYLVEHRQRKG